MADYNQIKITVGDNTNVVATSVDLTDDQKQKLRELQKMVPGDISISPDGIVSITSQKGLKLFNNFCQQNNIQDSSTHALMQIEAPKGSSLPLEGIKSAAAFCASFGRGETDPSKMSFTELMTLMLMTTYTSEADRRNALAELKSTQLEIARDIAVATWETSREAAEETCEAEKYQAWGTIVSGVANAAIAIGSAAYSHRASKNSKTEKIDANNEKIAKNKLLRDQEKLQEEFGLPDSQEPTIKGKKDELEAENKTLQERREIIESGISDNKANIAAKQEEIDQKQREIASAPEAQKRELEAQKRELEAQKRELEAQKTGLEGSNVDTKAKLETNEAQSAKLDRLAEIRKKIDAGELSHSDYLSDGEVESLEAENKKLERELVDIQEKVGMIGKLGEAVASVTKGSVFDLNAAESKRKAAFLEADAKLLDSFRSVILSQTQGIDSSINAATQNMQKITGGLKQVLDETYNVLSGIARNI